MNNFQTQFLHLMNRLLENSERLIEEIQLLRSDFHELGKGASAAGLLKNLFARTGRKGR